jgi:hypothetical protein
MKIGFTVNKEQIFFYWCSPCNDNIVPGTVMTALKAEFGEGANALVKGFDVKNSIRIQKIYFAPLL